MNAQLPFDHFPDHSFTNDALTGSRFRAVGDLTLDQFHRDGRVDAEWLGLSLREFALLWRLAAAPGERLTSPQLRAEAWRISFDPENDGVAWHIEQVRTKLAVAGLDQMVRSDAEGCHFIDLPSGSGLVPFAAV